MKKVAILATCIMLFSVNLFAQFSTDWIRPAEAYQKNGVMLARDNQDNVITTGYWTSNNIYTRKYNKFGVLQWETTSASGIASNYERPVWITTDNNRNVFVAGYRYAGASTANAMVVLKYSADGLLLWKKIVEPVNYLVGMNLRCEVDNNGNLYVGATGVGVLPGFALIKFDPNGTILFTQHSAANTPGFFNSMRVKDNKVALSASGGPPAGGDPNIATVAVWDTSGAFMWGAGVQGRGGKDVEIDDAGNVYLLTCFFNQVTAASEMDIELFKFDASGTQLWKRDFDFGGTEIPSRFTLVAGKLSLIAQGNIAASYFDWVTMQTDTDGNMLWNTRYNASSGNDEIPYFIAAKTNGEVFVTGKGGPSPDPNNTSYLRMLTLKYSNAGSQTWIDSTNIYSGWGYGCTLASDNSLYAISSTAMSAFHFLDHTGAGPCNVPTGLAVANITNSFATFSWTAVPNATLYHLRYKPVSSTTWNVVSYNLTSINVFGLYAGTTYEYAVEAVCDNGPTGYGPTQIFTTTGTAICTSVGQNQTQEYLSQVWLMSGFNNVSGNNNGYADFTNISAPITRNQLVQGYLSALVPFPEYEYYSIWIDYNHDNDFDDAGEEAVTLYTDFTGLIGFNFTVPATAALGATRMRVVMSHDSPATPCGTYARGETEDYTVVVNDGSINPPAVPLGLTVFNITNSSAVFAWTPDNTAASYNLRYKRFTENTWTIAPSTIPSIAIPGLAASTDYDYAVEAVGSAGRSGYSSTQAFTTLGPILPINGLNLWAVRQGTNVLITWNTSSEQNSARFEIEKSVDGINFISIGQVQAAGYSTNLRSYRFIDMNAGNTLLFYRLKIIDAGGSHKLSDIRAVLKTAAAQDLLLYPNPAVSDVNIALSKAAAEDMNLQVVNQMGQVVVNNRINKGVQLYNLTVSNLAKGMYVVKLTGKETVLVRKLFVK
ncbi:MAG: fibronectin type III domain-containing protein [Ferruginibacter sp.]|nr:fibronectin type III domain-containing protein [Ferruginibacter sp.]